MSPKSATDVFGAAYPYEKRAQLIEAYGERTFTPGRGLVGLKPFLELRELRLGAA